MLLEFRAAHGAFPVGLDELGAKFSDPFDGKSLRFKRRGDSVRVWSIGPDMKDNAGVSRAEKINIKGVEFFDVVASYPPLVRKK